MDGNTLCRSDIPQYIVQCPCCVKRNNRPQLIYDDAECMSSAKQTQIGPNKHSFDFVIQTKHAIYDNIIFAISGVTFNMGNT